jgi:hypothetical protein
MISSIDYNSDLVFEFKKTDGHSESGLYNSLFNGYCKIDKPNLADPINLDKEEELC